VNKCLCLSQTFHETYRAFRLRVRNAEVGGSIPPPSTNYYNNYNDLPAARCDSGFWRQACRMLSECNWYFMHTTSFHARNGVSGVRKEVPFACRKHRPPNLFWLTATYPELLDQQTDNSLNGNASSRKVRVIKRS